MNPDRWIERILARHRDWQNGHGDSPHHPSLGVDENVLARALDELADRLAGSHPFFHPRYAGQMIKPPHPVAVLGYLAGMLVNSNNHALDGGPATSRLEVEAVAALAAMLGFGTHLGHLTGGGTVANLEALFVARETHPDRGIAFSTEAHYTHARMCHLLGVPAHPVPVDRNGRMDLDALRSLLATGTVGTVVATAGTPALGAVDPVHDILPLARAHGSRVHVDAAYGGFFALLARGDTPPLVDPAPWRAVASCDSVVIDPHKHGLQPYGCGAVLFADPSVARFYDHDSPYTYFTSNLPHLGETSLECSRPGAAAAALWLTLKVLPLTRDGLGEVLAAGRRAALRWSTLLRDSADLCLFQQPELDIVTYYPRCDPPTLSQIDRASASLLDEGMRDQRDPVYLSTSHIPADAFIARQLSVVTDRPRARILRSVLMKPESETYLGHLHRRVEALARALRPAPAAADPHSALDPSRSPAPPGRNLTVPPGKEAG
ncbi:aminotransferase class I/II-fold pyridoxal phosphate-dependent enzyme [Kitasatospora purpeofusca]|uniref:pyridoxal phosphate-dependent decarboxylase family protein n=1 Tax=Kitasatospora purpeofusca TaxID=67352 RepID=UPI002E101BAF|nr:aminotransferase class I/II-fold pyridoxal phosphate-dependent enzyme [Kitasatospora purpeofusca]WSR37895.1 aminotransferase class I/II-fold pyridoxal phosphate-dependent enzyme [Kitasatospora purpeofusca]